MKKLYIVLSLLLPTTMAIAQTEKPDSRTASPRELQSVARTNTTWYISPLQVSERGVGLGLGVEMFPGKNDILSISLPFSIALPPNEYGRHNDQAPISPTSYPSVFSQNNYERETFYFYPGIKIYPGGAFKTVRYAIGVNMLAAIGRYQQVTRNYDLSQIPGSGPYAHLAPPLYNMRLASKNVADISLFKIGPMLTNSLNVRPSKHFYMGIDFSLGYTYISRNASERAANEMLVQLGVKFGYAH